VGPSSGAHLLAARELRARYPGLRYIVTFFCDEGEKYINDYFLGAWPTVSGPAARPRQCCPITPAAPREPGLIPLRLNIRAIRLTPTASACNGSQRRDSLPAGTGDG
jgi:hypothetical protein